jgi:LysR family hydrogen peroxide-inducible transcriptional activator
MELHQLRYLVAIAETGNFTRAAERSHITQPSLSQQILNLEKEVGHKLFHRLGRKAVLTEAGATFLERARRILFEVENAAKELQDHPSLDRRITVGAVPTVAPYLVAPLIERCRESHPNLLVHMREDFRSDLTRASPCPSKTTGFPSSR